MRTETSNKKKDRLKRLKDKDLLTGKNFSTKFINKNINSNEFALLNKLCEMMFWKIRYVTNDVTLICLKRFPLYHDI